MKSRCISFVMNIELWNIADLLPYGGVDVFVTFLSFYEQIV